MSTTTYLKTVNPLTAAASCYLPRVINYNWLNVYMDLRYDSYEAIFSYVAGPHTFYQIVADETDCVVISRGLSKAFAFAPWAAHLYFCYRSNRIKAYV